MLLLEQTQSIQDVPLIQGPAPWSELRSSMASAHLSLPLNQGSTVGSPQAEPSPPWSSRSPQPREDRAASWIKIYMSLSYY